MILGGTVKDLGGIENFWFLLTLSYRSCKAKLKPIAFKPIPWESRDSIDKNKLKDSGT